MSAFVHVLRAVFYTASLDEISAAKLIFHSRLVSSSQLNRSDKFQKKVPFLVVLVRDDSYTAKFLLPANVANVTMLHELRPYAPTATGRLDDEMLRNILFLSLTTVTRLLIFTQGPEHYISSSNK